MVPKSENAWLTAAPLPAQGPGVASTAVLSEERPRVAAEPFRSPLEPSQKNFCPSAHAAPAAVVQLNVASLLEIGRAHV